MRKIWFLTAVLMAASLLMISCGDQAGNAIVANKPANTSGNAAAKPADTAAVEADIKKMMDDFAAALNKGDVDAIGKMYSDDYTLIDGNGVMQTKAGRLEAVKSGKIKMEGIKFDDLKVKTNPTGDGAVVTGHVTGKTTIDGKTEENNSRVTWVLGKSNDKGWQFVNAQITNIKADAAKPDDKKADEKKTAAPANK
jgi:ketosteroid isomerase-like protein